MSANFNTVTLAEISKKNKGFYGIGASAVPYSKKLYTYLRITDIKDDGTLDTSDLKSVDDEKAKEYLLKPNDIVIARTGASTGRSYFYDGTDGELVYAGFLIKFSIDETKVNPKYIKYFCLSNQYKDYIKSFNTGSTRGNINAQTLGNMSINIPNREVQNKIVDVLSVIDEIKRENTNSLSTLYDMLQATYKQYTKARQLTNVLSDICAYTKKRIAVSDLTLDNYYSTENMLPNKLGAVRAAGLPSTAQTVGCDNGNVLVSNIRPYFKKILYCYNKGGCSNDVLCFTPKNQELSAYLFSTLYDDYFFDFVMAGSKGTKMPRGDKQQIMTYPIYLPTDEELKAFNELAVPILEQINAINIEDAKLTELRDTLLPKLISGELDVSEVNI